MICPVCGDKLRAIERSGIEVDICPGCKGLWLDRGELDKLISLEKTNADIQQQQREIPRQAEMPPQSRPVENQYRERDDHDDYDDRDRQYDSRYNDNRGVHNRKKRKGSWLEEIFDGFGGDD